MNGREERILHASKIATRESTIEYFFRPTFCFVKMILFVL